MNKLNTYFNIYNNITLGCFLILSVLLIKNNKIINANPENVQAQIKAVHSEQVPKIKSPKLIIMRSRSTPTR